MKLISLALACLTLIFAPAAHAETNPGPRAFIAVEVADIDASQAWYANAFQAELVNSFSREQFEQRILRGPDVIVELVQRKPPFPAEPDDTQGIMKAGVVVDDLDAHVERWRASGVELVGRRIHDNALGLDTILLRDPDGNLLQAFGRPATQPR